MRIQEVILENVLALAREDFSDTIIAAGIAQRWLGMLDAKARITDYKYGLALYSYHGQDPEQYRYSISIEISSLNSSVPILHQPVGRISVNGEVEIQRSAGSLMLNLQQRQQLSRAAKVLVEKISGV